MPTRVEWELEASLQCELDGHPIAIEARRGVIVVRVEAAKTVVPVLKALRRFGSLRSTLTRLNRSLLVSAQRLELYADNVMVVSMGHGTGSGLLRLAGIRNLRLWPIRLLWR